MPTLKSLAENEKCQIAECANAIAVREITDEEKKGIGMEGEIQIVLKFLKNRELRVPVSRELLAELGLEPSPH